MHFTSCGTLVIFITSSGEIFLIFFHCQFCYFLYISLYKKKKLLQDCFVLSCVACYFFCRNPFSSGLELESNGTPKGRTV